MKPKPSGAKSPSDPFQPLPSIGRRTSKGGLRDLLNKNRSTKTLVTTPELDEASINSGSSLGSNHFPDAPWAPPPLFQVYPQAVRHGRLETSNVSAPTILRLNEQQIALNNADAGSINSGGTGSANTKATSSSHRPATILAQAGWSIKVYALTTSGYILQYHGDGSFDRKPEHVMRLTKDSAAFATDAVPGRPYVLHVSQSCNDGRNEDTDTPKAIFSRMGIRTLGPRRGTSVFLLIFEAPDELELWLTSIRKLIASLGGPAYSPETAMGEDTPVLNPIFPQRTIVRKGSSRQPPVTALERAARSPMRKRSSSQSSSYTAIELERLRDSKASNATTVLGSATTPGGSPSLSPSKDQKHDLDSSNFMLSEPAKPSVDLQVHPIPSLSIPNNPVEAARRDEQSPRSPRTKTTAVEIDSTATRAWQGEQASPEDNKVAEREHHICHSPQTSTDTCSSPTTTTTSPRAVHSPRARELRPGNKYSLFPNTAEAPPRVPRRDGSMEHTRAPPHQNPTPTTASSDAQTNSKENRLPKSGLRVDNSDSLDRQLSKSADSAASTPSKSVDVNMPAEMSTHHQPSGTQPATKDSETVFGPPSCPPPSGPLPALPARPRSRPRRSAR